MKQRDRIICNDDSSLGRICKYRRVAQRVTAILIQRAISISIDHRRQVLGGAQSQMKQKLREGVAGTSYRCKTVRRVVAIKR